VFNGSPDPEDIDAVQLNISGDIDKDLLVDCPIPYVLGVDPIPYPLADVPRPETMGGDPGPRRTRSRRAVGQPIRHRAKRNSGRDTIPGV